MKFRVLRGTIIRWRVFAPPGEKLALRCIAGFLRVFSHSDGGLLDENIEHALANLTSMQMVLFPLLEFEPAKHQIEQTPILNVQFSGWSRYRLLSNQARDLLVQDWSPDRCQLGVVWTIGKCRTCIEDNLCTTAN